ncbi:MAG: p-hydroxycinnamoyl CoA hydratase/lyase [Desulfobacterales bacterium]|nr:p-hydroxycinnamoyl CoA hydratase/lyase [Desulfobacterales bacterium]
MAEKFEYKNVILTVDGAAATVQFNRPHKKNAMSPDLHRDMARAFDEIEKQGGNKVIVLTGVGDSWCGGMDLEKFFLETKNDPKKWLAAHQAADSWFRRIKPSPSIVLASINGWCFGAAIALVGVCDLAIAAEDAVFGLSEVNFGMMPGGGTTWSVAHNFNRKQGLYYSLTGETFTGKEAAEMGLVSHAFPKEKLAEETGRIVKNLVNKNGLTLGTIKAAYEKVAYMDNMTAVDYENAKLHELSYLSGNAWVKDGLTQFKDRKYKPGLEAYKIEKGE